MDALKSLVQPLVGGVGGSSVIDGVKLVVLGGTVETARRVSSSAWSHFVNSFFLTAHFSEEDYPYDWLMLWLSRRPEWQRSREFETTTRTTTPGLSGSRSLSSGSGAGDSLSEFDEEEEDDDTTPGRVRTRVVFQPTFDTTHTIYYRGHWLRVRRGRKTDGSGCEVLSISVVARSNTILKQLVLQAKREYEAEAIHRIQIYFADSHGSWRWTDSRHKRPMSSIVLNPGVKEMLLNDTRDFLKSEKWYADRGIPFRRGYLLHGVPGSGKSSLIHAIAGELMLDIYVVSLSSSWISDSTLTTLMGRVPARCVVLLEDLDAAFTRSVTRDKSSNGTPDSSSNNTNNEEGAATEPSNSTNNSRHRRHKDHISDVNTLSLSGLLNALDGVAAAEGRILFATTNHLERLDPALSRPGRMDVWIEFKNASKWQAEALFRNFFPSTDDDPEVIDGALDGIDLPMSAEALPLSTSPPQSPVSSSHSSTLWSLSPSMSSSTSSLTSSSAPSRSHRSAASASARSSASGATAAVAPEDFGAKNQAYLPPPVADHIAACQHSAKPLDGAKLARLAKNFADAIPDEEFSVAALQGYLLKNKSQPETAANEAAAWVQSERELKERLQLEKEAREIKEQVDRERRRREALEKEKEKNDQDKLDQELARLEKKEQELTRLLQLQQLQTSASTVDASVDVIPIQSISKEKSDMEDEKPPSAKGDLPADTDSDDENVPPDPSTLSPFEVSWESPESPS